MSKGNVIYPEFINDIDAHLKVNILTAKRRILAQEGMEAIDVFRKHLMEWRNADKIATLLDEIEVSKVILYGMCEHEVDQAIISFLTAFNKILHDLLHEAIVEGERK